MVGATITAANTNSTGTASGLYDPWGTWNRSYTFTTTGSAITAASTDLVAVMNQAIWSAWVINSASTTTTGIAQSITAANSSIFTNWIDMQDLGNSAAAQQRLRAHPGYRKPTKEEVAAALKREAEHKAAAEKAEADRKKARERADLLLRESLTPQQREDLAAKNCFYLESIDKDGKRRKYRIDRGTHGNIKLLDDANRIIGSYCVQPNGVPIEDAMLAQKLWIETDEAAFIKAANFRPQAAA